MEKKTAEVVSDNEAKESTSASSTSENPGGADQQKDMVSYDTHKKLLSQRKNDIQKMQVLQEKLDLLEQEKKQTEEAKLAEQGEYKKLLDLRSQELEEARTKLSESDKRWDEARKLDAVTKKLPGKIKKEDYYEFLYRELDGVVVDPETNRIDEHSVDKVVNNFVTNYSDLIVFEKAKIPPGAPSSPGISTFEQEIRTARTQKEFDAIRKKYGRE